MLPFLNYFKCIYEKKNTDKCYYRIVTRALNVLICCLSTCLFACCRPNMHIYSAIALIISLFCVLCHCSFVSCYCFVCCMCALTLHKKQLTTGCLAMLNTPKNVYPTPYTPVVSCDVGHFPWLNTWLLTRLAPGG